jgi:hypothetical protein
MATYYVVCENCSEVKSVSVPKRQQICDECSNQERKEMQKEVDKMTIDQIDLFCMEQKIKYLEDMIRKSIKRRFSYYIQKGNSIKDAFENMISTTSSFSEDDKRELLSYYKRYFVLIDYRIKKEDAFICIDDLLNKLEKSIDGRCVYCIPLDKDHYMFFRQVSDGIRRKKKIIRSRIND